MRNREDLWIEYEPKTKLGEVLKKLRQEYIDNNGQLLTEHELELDLIERRCLGFGSSS